jgi:hypothetical protein
MSLFAYIEYCRAQHIPLQLSSLPIAFLLRPLRRSHVLVLDARRASDRALMWELLRFEVQSEPTPVLIVRPLKALGVSFVMPWCSD